jgi:hypothetical protein
MPVRRSIAALPIVLTLLATAPQQLSFAEPYLLVNIDAMTGVNASAAKYQTTAATMPVMMQSP